MDGRQALDKYRRLINDDVGVAALSNKISDGQGHYADADKLASKLGRHAGQVLAEAVSEQAQGGSITEREALEILRPTMTDNYRRVADATEQVQRQINEDAGTGLSPIRPEMNRDRIEGIARELATAEDAAALTSQIISQVENASMAIVDDSVRANADFQYEVGRSPKIIRESGGGCCKWCADLDGVYDYESVRHGSDVFRRHANCRCVVEFDAGNGSRQNVHTRRMVSRSEAEARRERILTLQDQSDRIEADTRPMANGPRRGRLVHVNEREQEVIRRYADEMGIPRDLLSFNTGDRTGYIDGENVIHIRGDIFPADYAANSRSILNAKCALAHEYYGHYLHQPSQWRPGDWRDEFRASYRAAIDSPGLTSEERRLLMLDAFDRPREAGVSVHFNEEAKKYIYGSE